MVLVNDLFLATDAGRWPVLLGHLMLEAPRQGFVLANSILGIMLLAGGIFPWSIFRFFAIFCFAWAVAIKMGYLVHLIVKPKFRTFRRGWDLYGV